MRILLTLIITALIAGYPHGALAMMGQASADTGTGSASEIEQPPLVAAQRGGMTLSQAIESIKSRGNVERVLSATTEVRGGREVHVIRVLTRDGKVQTHRVQGRQRSRG